MALSPIKPVVEPRQTDHAIIDVQEDLAAAASDELIPVDLGAGAWDGLGVQEVFIDAGLADSRDQPVPRPKQNPAEQDRRIALHFIQAPHGRGPVTYRRGRFIIVLPWLALAHRDRDLVLEACSNGQACRCAQLAGIKLVSRLGCALVGGEKRRRRCAFAERAHGIGHVEGKVAQGRRAVPDHKEGQQKRYNVTAARIENGLIYRMGSERVDRIMDST